MTATMAEPKRCETCGRTVCDVRVAGGGGMTRVLTARGHEVVRTQGSGAVAGPVKA